MENVSLAQLKTVCNLYLSCNFPYFEELREAFFVLDICGCRIEELFQINRWTYVSGDIVTLLPQKNNLPRTITLDENTQNFKNCIINQTKPFLSRTSYQLQFLFRKLNPYCPIFSGGREISLYCYRYKHIWEAKAAGQTNEQIMNEMGHRTVTPILLYLAAVINSTYYIEPYNPDPLPVGHNDIILPYISFNGVSDYFISTNPIGANQVSYYVDADISNTAVKYILGFQYGLQYKTVATIDCRYNAPYTNYKLTLTHRVSTNIHQISGDFPGLGRFKMVFTLDFSEIGSSGGNYRNVYAQMCQKDIGNNSNQSLNKLVQYPLAPNVTIGASSNNGTSFSSFVQGNVYNLLTWPRILNQSEIDYLLSL
jgi:hypothetical protein